jgi:hypothetical protein
MLPRGSYYRYGHTVAITAVYRRNQWPRPLVPFLHQPGRQSVFALDDLERAIPY